MAVCLVVGWIAGWAHDASTRHVICPEHGEQIEATKLAQRPIADGQSRIVGTAGAQHGHDDCAIAEAMSVNGVAPSAPTRIAVVAAVQSVAIVAPPSATPLVVVVSYRIAPKTSPPRAS
ncbi:MAG TPA: hypothetical protein VGM90_29375 [Kofleriaceae bacterium]|jgi:hypothetical protein